MQKYMLKTVLETKEAVLIPHLLKETQNKTFSGNYLACKYKLHADKILPKGDRRPQNPTASDSNLQNMQRQFAKHRQKCALYKRFTKYRSDTT